MLLNISHICISKNLFKTFYNLSYLANTFVSKVISTTIGLLYNFLSFYDPTIFKIVVIGSLRANATLLDAVLALWGLNMLMSIPAPHMTDFIHLPIVSLDTHLWGFCFTINRVVTFFLSSFVLSRLCLITRTIHSLSHFGNERNSTPQLVLQELMFFKKHQIHFHKVIVYTNISHV